MSLTLEEAARLDALACELIPPAPGHLSAAEAGVGGTLLAAAQAAAPELEDLFRDALAVLPRGASVFDLKAADPARFERFAETVAALYFMAPDVRRVVGFPGRAPRPARIDPTDIEDLLLPVLEAGFAPRPA